MLKLSGIYKTFNQGTEMAMPLYQDLNLEVKQGEFVVIIGSNGSGKSTLLNLICGQILQDKGQIEFEGQVLANKNTYQRFKSISRVYQDPLVGTSPSLTVFENLSLALHKGQLFNLKRGLAWDKKAYLQKQLQKLNLGLEHKMDIQVGKLSGGQRQALSLLMAFLNEPHLLLLDEHTAALDPKNSEIIMQLTHDMVQDLGITTVMVTHNLTQALEYGTRLLMFHEGKIIADFQDEAKAKLTRNDLIQLFVEYEDIFMEIF